MRWKQENRTGRLVVSHSHDMRRHHEDQFHHIISRVSVRLATGEREAGEGGGRLLCESTDEECA